MVHLHVWKRHSAICFDDGVAEWVCETCGQARNPGPGLRLKRTEQFHFWTFRHYHDTDFVVRTDSSRVVGKFWVQSVRNQGPVFAAPTLEECETWILANL